MPRTETPREVLRHALILHGYHEAPSPREVLQVQIRVLCALQDFPRPDFDHWPPSELAGTYMSELPE